MSKINPIDLPEVRLSIAEHLKKPNLVRCLRVCRSWYDTFLPSVWKDVLVDKSPRARASQNTLTPEALRSHCHLIKELDIVDRPGNYPFVFPKIQTLYFRLFNGTTPSPAKYPGPFIMRNQSLVKLHLWNLTSDNDHLVWKVLLRLPHLREQGLGISRISEDDVVRFWTICESIESLLLDHVLLPQGITVPASMCFRNIWKLHLYAVDGMKQEQQFCFIAACPNLRDLMWYYFSTIGQEDPEENEAMD